MATGQLSLGKRFHHKTSPDVSVRAQITPTKFSGLDGLSIEPRCAVKLTGGSVQKHIRNQPESGGDRYRVVIIEMI